MSWLDKLTPGQKAAILAVASAGLVPGVLPFSAAAAAVGVLLGSSKSSSKKSNEEDGVAVVFNKETSQQMQRIAALTGISEGEVLKRALALVELAAIAEQEDQTLAFLDKSDGIAVKITGLFE